jgi:hypothetical protein
MHPHNRVLLEEVAAVQQLITPALQQLRSLECTIVSRFQHVKARFPDFFC